MNPFNWLTQTPSGSVAAILAGFFVVLFFYTVPTWLAISLNSKYKKWISVTNILLGWTIVGWIIVLVWALVSARDAEYPTTPEP